MAPRTDSPVPRTKHMGAFSRRSACGWAIEGILPIMYAEMPSALLWPAASWHVLVNVFVGGFVFGSSWKKNRHLNTLIAFGTLGLIWGFWGTWFWPLEGIGTHQEFNGPLNPPSSHSLRFHPHCFSSWATTSSIASVGLHSLPPNGKSGFGLGFRWLGRFSLLKFFR